MNAPIPSGALAIPTIPINEIVASPTNPRKRFDETYLQELGESIKEHGLIQPITVRPISVDGLLAYNHKNSKRDDAFDIPNYEIVVGECRWRAAKIAGLTDIPAFWRELDDKQVLEIQVVENLQRRDVHPLEEADGYRQLIDRHGYTAEQIGEKIGKSKSYVYARMKLSALGSEARDAFLDGQMEASVALLIARIPSEKNQAKAIKQLKNQSGDEPITFRTAKWSIKQNFTIDLCQATFPLDDELLQPEAGSCTACPKRSGNHPELCPDTDRADVCTDLGCFENKRLARREQLIENAKAQQIPVYTGDEVKKISTHGTIWSVNSNLINVDEGCDEDPEGRTYRQILGDTTPVSVMAEFTQGRTTNLVSYADESAIATALKEAGIELDSDDEAAQTGNASPDNHQAQSTAPQDDRASLHDLQRAEQERRAPILQAIKDKLIGDEGVLNTDLIFNALAIAFLRQEACDTEMDEWLLSEFDIELPESYDEDEELDKICSQIASWPLGKAMAFLTIAILRTDREARSNWQTHEILPAHGMDAMAKAIGIQTEITSPVVFEVVDSQADVQPGGSEENEDVWPFPKPAQDSSTQVQPAIEAPKKPRGKKAKAQ